MTAQVLTNLLAAKHAKDVFVPQCKTGPTNFGDGLQILDAWAMKKSWANPITWGYEIKVSRGDFVSDLKWRGYLDFCSSFYFVAPPGLIDPRELPAEAGLLVASKNLTRLFVKKKAPHREVTIPESIYRYVFMWRAEIRGERNGKGGIGTDLDYWRDWLAQKEEKRKVGHQVSHELRRLTGERILDAERNNQRLSSKIERLEEVERVLEELGINPSGWNPGRELERRVAEIRGGIPETLLRDIDGAAAGLRKLRERLAETGATP